MSLQKGLSKILHYFQKTSHSASVAKERLQIIIAHERTEQDKPDYLPMLQKDLIEVIAKYVPIDVNDVRIDLDRQSGCSILELNIMLPDFADARDEETGVISTGA